MIVAENLDTSSERIVDYLARRGIGINVVCFQVFDTGATPGAGQLLSRAWLMDPAETQVAAIEGTKDAEREPWNGEYYVSFGDPDSRDWDEARRFGFISAGGGAWYSGTLDLLKPNDRVWVKIPGQGFVGVGRVRGTPVKMAEFTLPGPSGAPAHAAEILQGATYHRALIDGDERCEWFVPVDWLQTVPREQAVQELGMFGNQNTVCAPKTPKWRHTTERLKVRFPGWDSAQGSGT